MEQKAMRIHKETLAVCVAAAAYSVVVVFMKFRLFDTMKLGLRDLCIFDQALWSLVNHGSMYSTIAGENILGEHTSFILVLIAPFYLFDIGPKILLLLQGWAVGLGALPVYYLAAHLFKNRWAGVIFGCCYLLYPVTGYVHMDEVRYGFHPDSFLPLFYLTLFYCLSRRKRLAGIVFALLVLAVKEDTGITIALLGLYTCLFIKDVRPGLLLLLLGVGWALCATNIIIPYYHGSPSRFLGNYGYLGDSLWEIAAFGLRSPGKLFGLLWEHGLATYLVVLLAPFLFFACFCPEVLLLVLPALLLNLLTDPARYEVPLSPVSWHAAPLLPFVVVASIKGTKRICFLLKTLSRRMQYRWRKVVFVVPLWAVLSAALGAHVLYGVTPLSLSFWNNKSWPVSRFPLCRELYNYTHYYETDTQVLLPQLERLIPEDASLSATFYLGAQFGRRQRIYWFPKGVDTAAYVLLDIGRALNGGAALRFVNDTPEGYELLFFQGTTYLYEKCNAGSH